MKIISYTNGAQRKVEYPVSSEIGRSLLSVIPSTLYGSATPLLVAEYSDGVWLALYFGPEQRISGVDNNGLTSSLKYNKVTGEYLYKTYELGNTSGNPVARNVQVTGKLSNSSNYTLYFSDDGSDISSLMYTEDGLNAETYDAAHNLLYKTNYKAEAA
jgi:hypothetical protein